MGRLKLQGFAALVVAALPVVSARAQFPAAPGTGQGIAETVEAIDSARVTTRILYITAHPDDESAPILTYLARGLHADVALLSLTRGEGGQNALGPEQAPQLGLIRTEELLAATRGYGVKLYFTRAKDFGYSKTAEETEKVWGDQVLEDMVRVIRTFRPNIVINNLIGGHGHHVAAGQLTPKAVQLAADRNAYPEMVSELGGPALPAWGEGGNAVKLLNADRGARKSNNWPVPVDEISPLYGKSYREIALDAFSNHHTQGITLFLNSPFLTLPLALVADSGEPFDPKILAVSLQDWAKDRGVAWTSLAEKIENALHTAHDAALRLDWVTAAKSLAEARLLLSPTLADEDSTAARSGPTTLNFDIRKTEQHLDRALAARCGTAGFRGRRPQRTRKRRRGVDKNESALQAGSALRIWRHKATGVFRSRAGLAAGNETHAGRSRPGAAHRCGRECAGRAGPRRLRFTGASAARGNRARGNHIWLPASLRPAGNAHRGHDRARRARPLAHRSGLHLGCRAAPDGRRPGATPQSA